MAANQVSTIEALTGAEDYFLKVMKPNYDAYFGASSTFASAFNLATTLFHFHEWLFDQYKPQLEQNFNITFAGKGQFWQAIQGTNANFGYIRDVTNASKHVTIGGSQFAPPSTGITHIANTHIISTGYGQGGYGQGRYGGGPAVVFDDAGNQISFDDCASQLFAYWKKLLEQLTGKLYT